MVVMVEEHHQNELMHLKIGSSSNELVLALKSLKVGQSTDEEIKTVLRCSMLLVGIRAANIPQDEEKKFLVDFIKKHYSNYTTEEIRVAFEMAVAGKLELGKDGAKCYENFSCEYFGRIMRAYRLWADDEIKFIESKQKEVLSLPIAKQTPEEIVEFWLNEWKESKTKNYLLFGGFVQVYDIIEKEIDLTIDQKNAIVSKVRTDLMANVNGLREEKEMKAKINDENYIATVCKKLAVAMHFNKLIEIENF